MEVVDQVFLIVGLGNPGRAYEHTRHNIGFQILRQIADQHHLSFCSAPHIKGELARGSIGQKKVLLLLPNTYVNLSGEAVRLSKDYFHVPLQHILIVIDDVALPFGKLRLADKGSSGGHNGLKSIEHVLKTQWYVRLRFGIGDREHGALDDYVLGRFTAEECLALPSLVKQAAQVVQTWILEGSEPAKRACAPARCEQD